MSDLPLTKILDPADYDQLKAELKVVDRYFDPATQHTHRRWEYAMALRALSVWAVGRTGKAVIADVGGAGSTFVEMLPTAWTGLMIDPKTGLSVEETAQNTQQPYYDAVISISTFEHTTRPLAFLDACNHILKPGGLLFLTFDYAVDYTGRDDYHFHWMRERIIHSDAWTHLYQVLKTFHGYALFGACSWEEHEPAVYGYTFASLCLRKP